MKLTLYGGLGGGSAAIEAALAIAGLEFEFVQAASWDGEDALTKLVAVNPLGQVPVLVLEDGTVLTESAAILFWIGERAPETKLVPPPGDERRTAFLRWMIFVPANLYAMFTIGDDPSRWVRGDAPQRQLQEKATERTRFFWNVLEAALEPAPFALGERMTALDLFIAMISHWRPGRRWFEEHCPKLAGAAHATEEHPAVAAAWARNFKKPRLSW